MIRIVRLAALSLVVTLSLVAGHQASASCVNNRNSSLNEIDGEYVCAYTGDGCSACYTGGPRGPGSWDLCYYDASGDLACTYYN